MKKILAGLALAVLSVTGLMAGQAGAAGSVCGSVHVVVNGQDVVNEASCQVLP